MVYLLHSLTKVFHSSLGRLLTTVFFNFCFYFCFLFLFFFCYLKFLDFLTLYFKKSFAFYLSCKQLNLIKPNTLFLSSNFYIDQCLHYKQMDGCCIFNFMSSVALFLFYYSFTLHKKVRFYYR